MSNTRYFTVEGSSRTFDRNKLLAVMLFAFGLALLQVSAVNNLLPALESVKTGLGASDNDVQWVLSGYALAFGVILIPVGRFGDIFGRSGGFATGIALFALASLGCGLATDPLMLNIMRIFQGFSAGVFSPQVTALIQEYFEGKDRAWAFGIMGLVISASVAAGPILSGLFVETIGWRWAFIINFPLGVILFILALMWLPFGKERRTIGKKGRNLAKSEGVKRPPIDLDPLGNILIIVAVVCIMLPFMTYFVWRWALLAGGLVMIALWVAWESHYKKIGRFPMVDLSLFRIPTYAFSTAVVALLMLGSTSIFVVVAMFLQKGLELSALQTGLIGLPNALISAYFSLWTGKRAFEKGAQIQCAALVAIATGALTSIPVAWAVVHGVTPWLLAAPLALCGLGMGMIGSANQTQAMLQIPPARAGTAGGVLQTSQRVTTAIGNAMVTAVLFIGRGMGDSHTPTEWFRGFTFAMIVISIALVASAIIAFIYMRKYPHAGPDLVSSPL